MSERDWRDAEIARLNQKLDYRSELLRQKDAEIARLRSAPGETEADRQWRESGMWQEWLTGYERVSDDMRAADPRYMSVERWTYRLLSTGHCPGSLPVAHAIIEDLDALDTPTHEMEALREALDDLDADSDSGSYVWATGVRYATSMIREWLEARRALAQHVGGEG